MSGVFEKGWVAMIYVTMKEAVEIAKAERASGDRFVVDSVQNFRAMFHCVAQKVKVGEDICFLFQTDEGAADAGKLFQPKCQWDENEFMDITEMVAFRGSVRRVFINSVGAVNSYTAGTVFWTKLSELVGEMLSQFPAEMHSDLLMPMQDACSVYGSDYEKFLKERWQS